MDKMVVITDRRTADGFGLAGVEVRRCDTTSEAQESLIALIQEEGIGIIALDERLRQAIDERIERKLAKTYRPLLIILPLEETLDVEILAQRRLGMLIRKAIGFDVTLKRG